MALCCLIQLVSLDGEGEEKTALLQVRIKIVLFFLGLALLVINQISLMSSFLSRAIKKIHLLKANIPLFQLVPLKESI